jgi:exopolysaccharide biosynthesis WecB/TagA/CpsF family protein
MQDSRMVQRAGFAPWKRSRLLNVWIDDLTIDEIVERLDNDVLFTVNAVQMHELQRDAAFAEAYRTGTIVSADGKYVFWALRWLGRGVRAKASGSDIVPAYWRHHAQNPAVRIFLLGAGPGIADKARERINRLAGREIVVAALGPSMNFVNDEAEIDSAIDTINASGATCLIVGFGAPKQELWIARYRHRMPGVRVIMGVGATIDYEAEAVRRAPQWMAHAGLEWLYRVASEPRRYWRRYFESVDFLWLALLDRMGRYRPPAFVSPISDTPAASPAHVERARAEEQA